MMRRMLRYRLVGKTSVTAAELPSMEGVRRFRNVWRSLPAAALFAVLPISEAALAEAPVTRRFEGELVSPSGAFGYYGSGTTHTEGPGSTSERAPEIRALARALSRDGTLTGDVFAGRVAEYVQKNIVTEFRFGLGKGARGAAIDQSGTVFDQAELMVEILREGGQSASYRLGTITLTAAEFGKWTGLVNNLNQADQTFVVNAQAACKMLADGGIPASVNGASSCSGLSGSLSTVTLAHLWVVTNGKSYDPGFKISLLKNGIDVANAMGCGTLASPTCGSDLQTAALTGATQGTANGASYIQNVNEAAVVSYVQARALELQQAIEASGPSQPIEDIVGGKTIDLKQTFAAGAALPYEASVQSTWSGEIPDQYRTRFGVQFMGIDAALFADEIAGKRIRLATIAPQYSFARTSRIYIDGTSVAVGSAPGIPLQRDQVLLEVNHPFAAGTTAGTYADDSIQISLTVDQRDSNGCIQWSYGSTCGMDFFQIYTLYLDAGRAGSSREQHFSKLLFDHREDGIEPEMRGMTGPSPEVYSGFDRRAEIPSTIAKHAAQTSQAVDLAANLIRANVGQLHHLGSSFIGGDQRVYFNIASAFSSVSRTSALADATSAFDTVTALAAALEGSVLEEGNGAWESSASVSMFKLSNAQGYRFYLANSSNISGVLNATSNYTADRKSILTSYATSGYDIILPSSGIVGEVDLPGSGTGLVAIGTSPELIYKDGSVGFLLNELYKGGGAVSVADPAKDAIESAKVQSVSFKDKKYYGVDLASGHLNLTPPSDIRVGIGEGVLEFTRTYSSNRSGALKCAWIAQEWPNWRWGCESDEMSAPSYIGGGWDHNFNIKASWSGSASETFGNSGALRGAHSIAAIYSLLDVNRQGTFQRRMTGIFAAYSLIQSFAHNLVAVSNVGSFVRLPSGDFDPPPGRRGIRLSQIGSFSGPFAGVGGVARSYHDTSFELVEENGRLTVFQPWQGAPYGAFGGPINNRPAYAVVNIIEPSGLKTTFAYDSFVDVDTQQQRKVLEGVANSFGNSLEFAHAGSADSYDVWYRLSGVSDASGREASYACSTSGLPYTPPVLLAYTANFRFDCSVESENLMGGVSKYILYDGEGEQFGSDFPDRKIHQWFTPGDAAEAFLEFGYDPLLHVSEITNSENETTTFFVGNVESDSFRFGEQQDPLGNVTRTVFDKDGSAVSTTTPLGDVTAYTYDDSRRLLRTVLPEGNAIEYTYDARGNRLTECQIAKGRMTWSSLTALQERTAQCNTAQGDLLTSTTYVGGPTLSPADCPNAKTCNKVDHVVDPRGYRTNYTWSTTHGQLVSEISGLNGNGTCAVGSICPQTDYGYTSYTGGDGATFHLLTSKVDKIDATRSRTTTYAYDTANHHALKSATVSATGENETHISCFTFDAIGNLVSSTEPLGVSPSCP